MASSVDLLKILLQDTDGILTDPDYEAIVELEPNAYRAAATAARAIAAKYAERVDMGGGSSSLKLSQQVDHYLQLADDYDKRAQQGGDGGTGMTGTPITADPVVTGVDVDKMKDERADSNRFPSSFHKGFMDNPPVE